MFPFFLKYLCVAMLLSMGLSTIAQDSTTLKTKPEHILSFQTNNDILFYSNHPVLLPTPKVSNFGLVEVQYNYLEGKSRKRQEPDFSNKVNFTSLGIRDVKKFTVFGNFNYIREWQEGVGLAHRANINDTSPYYLFAQQPGNMDKVTYSLSGDVTRKIFHEKVLVGIGTDYLAQQNYRSIDPRPKIDVFEFKPRISWAWYFSKQKLLGITASYGYGKNNVTVLYKNELYKETLVFPEYINYLNMGFGYSLQQQNTFGGKTLKEENQQKEIEFIYATPFKKGDLTVVAGFKNKEQLYFRDIEQSITVNKIGTFYLDIPYFLVRYSSKNTANKWLWEMKLNQQNGQDFNNQLNGNNYISKETQANILIGITNFKNLDHNYELLFESSYSRIEKADGVSNNRMKISNTISSLSFAKYWYHNTNNIFRFNINTAFYGNIGNNLVTSPTFESYFVREVIRPDFDFMKTNRLQYAIQAQYLRKNNNKQNFFVKGEFTFQQLLNGVNSQFQNNNNRFQLNLKTGFVF